MDLPSQPPFPQAQVAIMGYGRFGAALGALLLERGLSVRAFDPVADVAPAAPAAGPAELVHGAGFVVIAVPVPRTSEALATLLPHLRPGQIVLDVGSVKVEPMAAMAELLGPRVPFTGTHPLFGPMSLTRGERPLRVVVCPSPLHPGAAAAVAALFSWLGCQVIEQDPEEHDRAMAWTHALAFFIAKGLLDAGVPAEAPVAPPSFQAIARTIETVRSDAGHLFATLHRHNPFSGEARRRLIEALVSADAALLQGREAPPGGPALPEPGIPDLGQRSPALRKTRELIDEVDQEIVNLLGRRAKLALRAAQHKAELGHGVLDPRREALLLDSRGRWAEALGLPAGEVRDIFQSILHLSRRIQEP